MFSQLLNSFLQVFVPQIPTHIAHAVIEHLHFDNPAIKAVNESLFAFFVDVGNRKYADALSRCTPELQTTLGSLGFESALEKLHTVFAGLDNGKWPPLEFNSDGTECRKAGCLIYADGRETPAIFYLKRIDDQWKIHAYHIGVSEPVTPNQLAKAKPEAKAKPAPASESAGVAPDHLGNCPSGYPVKGSRTGVYHMPGSRFYAATTPVLCFRSETQAKAAGYRRCRN